MHEMSVVSNIVNIALKTAGEYKLSVIKNIKVKVGSQHHLAPDLMEYAFSFFTKGTIAQGADLLVERVPVTMTCLDCNRTFDVTDNMYICPECSSIKLEMKSGRELLIENIEGEI